MPAASGAAQLSTSRLWTILAILAFALSTAATAYGIFASLLATGSGIVLSTIAGVMVSAFITGLAFISWHSVGAHIRDNRTGFVFGALLLGSLLLTALSLSFASAASIYLTQHTLLRGAVTREASDEVTSPLGAFADNLAMISMSARSVADIASRKSLREGKVGSTCGYTTKDGNGPLTRLRAQQAKDANRHADTADQMNDEAISLIVRAGVAIDQPGLNAVYQDAARLLRDPRRLAISNWAHQTRQSFEAGTFFWEEADRACSDADMLNALSELEAITSLQPGLPPTVPLLGQPTIFHAVAASVSSLASIIGWSDGTSHYRVQGLAVVPLVLLAFFVDSVGALSAVQIGRRPLPLVPPTDTEMFEHQRVRDIFSGLVIDQYNKAYLAVPHGGHIHVENDALYLACLCRMGKVPGFIQAPLRELRKLSQKDAQRINEVAGKVKRVTLYEMNTSAYSRLEVAVAALGFAKGAWGNGDTGGGGSRDPHLKVVGGNTV